MTYFLEAQPVRKTAFNAFVQQVQEEAMAFGIETRLRPSYDDDDDGQVALADFEAYWDGEWRWLAHEKPFVGEENSGRINPDGWLKIKFQAAGELAHS